jgi:hypothetical protein
MTDMFIYTNSEDTFISRGLKSSGTTAIMGIGKKPGAPWINPYPDCVIFEAKEKATLVPPADRLCMFCKEEPAVLSRMKLSHTGTGQHAGYRYCNECSKSPYF